MPERGSWLTSATSRATRSVRCCGSSRRSPTSTWFAMGDILGCSSAQVRTLTCGCRRLPNSACACGMLLVCRCTSSSECTSTPCVPSACFVPHAGVRAAAGSAPSGTGSSVGAYPLRHVRLGSGLSPFSLGDRSSCSVAGCGSYFEGYFAMRRSIASRGFGRHWRQHPCHQFA